MNATADPFRDPPQQLQHRSSTRRPVSVTPVATHKRANEVTPALRSAPPPMAEALKDVVLIKDSTNVSSKSNSNSSQRPKMSRITTAVPNSTSTRSTQPPGRSGTPPRRSLSSDSATPPPKVPPKSSSHAAKKASVHADFIDTFDISGLSGGMFHHEGPFDACAPSRNRHERKAPMRAFNAEEHSLLTDPSNSNTPLATTKLSPLAQATLNAMDSQSPYSFVGSYPKSKTPGSGYLFPGPNDQYPYPRGPLKKQHTTLAEAWGKAQPEPFEEFSAGAGSSASSVNGDNDGSGKKKEKPDLKEVYSKYLDNNGTPRRSSRAIPPPQPMFSPALTSDPDEADAPERKVPSSPPRSGDPKRNRSIISRIKKMRENPTVPMDSLEDDTVIGSDSGHGHDGNEAGRGHKHQASLLLRLGSSAGKSFNTNTTLNEKEKDWSPGKEKAGSEGGSFVLVTPNSTSPPPSRKGSADREKKSLPSLPAPTPGSAGERGFPDGYFSEAATVGRKTSLYRKMKSAVAGAGRAK